MENLKDALVIMAGLAFFWLLGMVIVTLILGAFYVRGSFWF